MRVCKIPESHLKQPVLCSFSCHFLSRWTAVENRFSWGQLLLVVINLVSCHSLWFGPYYFPRLWVLPSFTLLSFFSYWFSPALFVCLIYLIVTCRNFWRAFILEVEDHEIEDMVPVVDSASCLYKTKETFKLFIPPSFVFVKDTFMWIKHVCGCHKSVFLFWFLSFFSFFSFHQPWSSKWPQRFPRHDFAFIHNNWREREMIVWFLRSCFMLS